MALVRHVFAPLEAEGIETEMVQLGGQPIHGCVACYGCFASKDKRVRGEDLANDCIALRCSPPTR